MELNGNKINCGKDIVVDVDVTKFNDEVMAYVFRYGLRQMLSDVHSAVKKDEPDCKAKSLALINKKLTSLYAGEIRANGERLRLDPVEAEARRMALSHVQDKIRKAGKKLNAYTNDWYAEQADKYWKSFEKSAKKVVAIRAAEEEINLEDLDI